ncbi:MetQ/NlpA family ABC transporter substrate-binding protein [Schaalia sp. 19OD2882]|uniref:MetQ/NlpA family ABC transporter substrate-binding protein n=1 Tax=Schaalia sp. 19OD2882 TaxID=2794089 RepID=UPI001C1EC3E4|nr:MetQ/NlpA family ABC transporter substrate-binding protein [Schaalia sp. 19OD2882]QWW19420.1 MetQ/NlpA family ABC transporter substrate-binding protein [Schaalia sp. 19OD2882]
MRALRPISALAASAILVLAGCSAATDNAASGADAAGSGADSAASGAADGAVTLIVGASPTPHALILNYIDENLDAKENIDITVVEYTDYVQPNTALNEGELDANFFQTVPYLEEQSAEFGYQFEAGKGIHLEPLAIYSSKLKKVEEFPEGGKVGIISDTANQARALKLLADKGFVKLPASGAVNVNTVEKIKKFDFIEVEGPQLVRSLADVDVAVINGNFAQEGDLSQAKDAIAVESPENNPAVNVLVWKKGSEKAEAIAKLEKLLHSDEVKKFIEEKWTDGSVIPAF